jgi:ATP-dependent Clp protease adaptor protein ClpS
MSQTETPVKQDDKPTPSKPLPMWKVIVHNDDINTFEHVIKTFMEIVHLEAEDAVKRTMEVHHEGLSIVTVSHKEKAEFIQEQLTSKSLTVTIEPDSR